MALQSSASVGDPICLSEVKTEFDLISSDCLTGFYKPHSESSVPASGTICLSDFLGESQILTFDPDGFEAPQTVTFNTNYSNGGETAVKIPANMYPTSMKGHISTFLYTHNDASTHTLSVKHQHGGTGTSRTGQPYSTVVATGGWSGDNPGYFTDEDRWLNYVMQEAPYSDYNYITKVVYYFGSSFDGDDFTVTSEKPSGGWGSTASEGMWTFSPTGGLDGGGESTHTCVTSGIANQHLGAGAGQGVCGTAYRTFTEGNVTYPQDDRIILECTITYIPH